MKQSELIIKKKGTTLFWCFPGATGWSPEYPDARVFSRLAEAKQIIKKYSLRDIQVIGDYGLEKETVVFEA